MATQGYSSHMLYARYKIRHAVGEHMARLAKKQREIERRKIEERGTLLHFSLGDFCVIK
jgi:hypothetical protein